jgi:hypothetical protein
LNGHHVPFEYGWSGAGIFNQLPGLCNLSLKSNGNFHRQDAKTIEMQEIRINLKILYGFLPYLAVFAMI